MKRKLIWSPTMTKEHLLKLDESIKRKVLVEKEGYDDEMLDGVDTDEVIKNDKYLDQEDLKSFDEVVLPMIEDQTKDGMVIAMSDDECFMVPVEELSGPYGSSSDDYKLIDKGGDVFWENCGKEYELFAIPGGYDFDEDNGGESLEDPQYVLQNCDHIQNLDNSIESEEDVGESLNESKKTYKCYDCGYEVELSDDEYDGQCPNCGEHHGFFELDDEDEFDESLNEAGFNPSYYKQSYRNNNHKTSPSGGGPKPVHKDTDNGEQSTVETLATVIKNKFDPASSVRFGINGSTGGLSIGAFDNNWEDYGFEVESLVKKLKGAGINVEKSDGGKFYAINDVPNALKVLSQFSKQEQDDKVSYSEVSHSEQSHSKQQVPDSALKKSSARDRIRARLENESLNESNSETLKNKINKLLGNAGVYPEVVKVFEKDGNQLVELTFDMDPPKRGAQPKNRQCDRLMTKLGFEEIESEYNDEEGVVFVYAPIGYNESLNEGILNQYNAHISNSNWASLTLILDLYEDAAKYSNKILDFLNNLPEVESAEFIEDHPSYHSSIVVKYSRNITPDEIADKLYNSGIGESLNEDKFETGEIDQHVLNGEIYDALAEVAYENEVNGGSNTPEAFRAAVEDFIKKFFAGGGRYDEYDEALNEKVDELADGSMDDVGTTLDLGDGITLEAEDQETIDMIQNILDDVPKEESLDDDFDFPVSSDEKQHNDNDELAKRNRKMLNKHLYGTEDEPEPKYDDSPVFKKKDSQLKESVSTDNPEALAQELEEIKDIGMEDVTGLYFQDSQADGEESVESKYPEFFNVAYNFFKDYDFNKDKDSNDPMKKDEFSHLQETDPEGLAKQIEDLWFNIPEVDPQAWDAIIAAADQLITNDGSNVQYKNFYRPNDGINDKKIEDELHEDFNLQGHSPEEMSGLNSWIKETLESFFNSSEFDYYLKDCEEQGDVLEYFDIDNYYDELQEFNLSDDELKQLQDYLNDQVFEAAEANLN